MRPNAACDHTQGEQAEAQAEVDILNPGNGLDPAGPDYPAKLLKEIEEIEKAS